MRKTFFFLSLFMILNHSYVTAQETIYLSPAGIRQLQESAPKLFKSISAKEMSSNLARYPDGQRVENPYKKKKIVKHGKKRKRRGKKWTRLLAGLGIGTLFYSIQAERAWSQYKNSQQPQDSQREFNRLRNFENIRNAFIGATLISTQVKF